MKSEPNAQELLRALCQRDTRYPLEAYDFVFSALGYIQMEMEKKGLFQGDDKHVTGQQFAAGCRDFALEEYGMMAGAVLKSWNVLQTDDIGELVYNLIGIELMSKNETDRKEDFSQVFDLQKALAEDFRFCLA